MRIRRLLIMLAFGLALAFNAAAGDYFAVARWHQTAARKSTVWDVNHHLVDTSGKAVLSFVSKGAEFSHVKKSVAVSSVKEGDWFEFCFRTGKLPRGAVVDFGLTLAVSAKGAPERWICEVYDGKAWRSDDGPVSFTLKWFKGGNPSTYLHSFTLSNAIRKKVRVRVRSLDSSTNPEAKVYFATIPWVSAYMAVSTLPVRDRTSMVLLGNSFTYFGGTYYALREIARSQGHTLDMTLNLKGGQSLGQHLKLAKSQEAISLRAPYDVALLQNSSVSAAEYSSDTLGKASILADAVTMAERVREHSPTVRIVLERTWAYANKDYRGFGSYEAFDAALQDGAERISAAMGAELSPIGRAFILGRERGLHLYWKDRFHQSFAGAYLKACVNYLLLFGEPFTAGVSDYTLDPDTAALCRQIAAEVVNPK